MKEYTEKHVIRTKFSAPYSLNQNSVETFMNIVGKAIKVANYQKLPESEALKKALAIYRHIPHPATGDQAANYMSRDEVRTVFPRKASSNKELEFSLKISCI